MNDDNRRPMAIVVVAHPNPQSFNHALASSVHQALLASDFDCVFHDLHAEHFNPIITAAEMRGEATIDPLVAAHIRDLRQANLIAVIHPNHWGAPPAIMKGWMDRVFAPGAAYAFEKGIDKGDRPIGLLKAGHAVVFNTSNTPEDREMAVFGDPLERIWRDCLLGYCGVRNVRRQVFRIVATSTTDERLGWLRYAQEIIASLASRLRAERNF